MKNNYLILLLATLSPFSGNLAFAADTAVANEVEVIPAGQPEASADTVDSTGSVTPPPP